VLSVETPEEQRRIFQSVFASGGSNLSVNQIGVGI